MDANKYGFEPFEAVIALIVTQYIMKTSVSKAELSRIVNPRVIRLNTASEDKAEPISTEIDFPALVALLNAARDWYKGSGRGYEEKLTREMNEAIDQLMEDFDGERYLRTEPMGFYQYLTDLYMGM